MNRSYPFKLLPCMPSLTRRRPHLLWNSQASERRAFYPRPTVRLCRPTTGLSSFFWTKGVKPRARIEVVAQHQYLLHDPEAESNPAFKPSHLSVYLQELDKDVKDLCYGFGSDLKFVTGSNGRLPLPHWLAVEHTSHRPSESGPMRCGTHPAAYPGSSVRFVTISSREPRCDNKVLCSS
jgi:hypothetical protein